MSGHCTPLVALAATIVFPVLAMGQSEAPEFGVSSVQVVSELRGQDRGDGSGSYALTTTLTDASSDVTLRHELTAERTVEGEVVSGESLLVLEGGQERYRSESDPAGLGPYAVHATTWALQFVV